MKVILRHKVATGFLILIAGIIYGAYSFSEFSNGAVQEMEREIAALNNEITSRKSELNRVKQFAENIPAVQQSFREQSLQLESVLDSIPRSFEFNVLLKKFNLLAQNAGIELVSFKPLPGEKSEKYFTTANIELRLRGGFVSILVFLDQISKLKRVVAFDEIRMNAGRSSGETGKEMQISDTTVKLRAYRLGES